MGFPFIAPLKKRLTEKFKEREAEPNKISQYKPFALLSSAAVVVKGKTPQEVREYLKTENYPTDARHGCVVANTTDITRMYQTGETIVGNDLNGKAIIVEGESNRRVSVPIISKINIDTDGGNNTLKTAQVEIKVFTLKQLEMFELFFLRPSMNVVLEYGWSSDIRKGVSTIDSKLFAKKTWEAWKNDYVNLFSVKQDNNSQFSKKEEYLKILKETDYEYDYMAGKVTSFTISPDENGTYNITLEVSSGNELQLWVPVKKSKDEVKTKTQSKETLSNYQQFIEKIVADLQLKPENLKKIFSSETLWKNELFNFGAYNLTQKDITSSKTPYISFKFIIQLLNSVRDTTVIDYTWKDSAGNDVIPITSREYIISTTEDFIIPGDLPKIVTGKNKNNQDTIVIDVKSGKKDNLYINGKSFNFTDSISIYDYKTGKDIDNPKTTTLTNKKTNEKVELSSIGNLCNLFFNYDTFVEIWKRSYVTADIINDVLDSINNNMFGLCKLQLQVPEDISASQPLEIMDRKLDIYSKLTNNDIPYRFNVNNINSIVKSFQFNMELSTLMQAQSLYATQLAVNEATKKGQDDFEEPNINSRDEFKAADLSYAKNQDGYFSVNAIEYRLVKEAINTGLTEQENTPDTVEDKKLSEKIQSNYIKFKKNPIDKKEAPKNYIYQDSGLIQRYLRPVTAKESTALTYLDISFVIDGISGLSCGEYFQISGIPEVYNTNGFFQITNVKQNIDESDWLTEIEAGYRLKV
jgi:hypothetical protein